MGRRRSSEREREELKLAVPRIEAEESLTKVILQGEELLGRTIQTGGQLTQAKDDYHTWYEYCERLLERIFNYSPWSGEKRPSVYGPSVPIAVGRGPRPDNTAKNIESYRTAVSTVVRGLKSLQNQLELLHLDANTQTLDRPEEVAATVGSKVFIVHGHDSGRRDAVARFITRLKFDPIILEEQASASKTLIEKFESYSSDIAYAVVILTPDDLGATADKIYDVAVAADNPDAVVGALEPRARQNVIFELGFFFGKLGRKRVCALLAEGIKMPSDIDGVAYVPMDANGGWHMPLAREMRHAGLNIDMNDAL
jgi:predicted nucleotide-binding protein